jgi:hypothetical protein
MSQAVSNSKTTQTKKPNSPTTHAWDENTSANPSVKKEKTKCPKYKTQTDIREPAFLFAGAYKHTDATRQWNKSLSSFWI